MILGERLVSAGGRRAVAASIDATTVGQGQTIDARAARARPRRLLGR